MELFGGLLHKVFQPHLLDGSPGACGDLFQQLRLVFGPGAGFATVEIKHRPQMTIAQQREHDDRARIRGRARRSHGARTGVGQDILNHQHSAGAQLLDDLRPKQDQTVRADSGCDRCIGVTMQDRNQIPDIVHFTVADADSCQNVRRANRA